MYCLYLKQQFYTMHSLRQLLSSKMSNYFLPETTQQECGISGAEMLRTQFMSTLRTTTLLLYKLLIWENELLTSCPFQRNKASNLGSAHSGKVNDFGWYYLKLKTDISTVQPIHNPYQKQKKKIPNFKLLYNLTCICQYEESPCS